MQRRGGLTAAALLLCSVLTGCGDTSSPEAPEAEG
ncbi:MAG: hypothetical protein AVDCRST_MAG61-1959, partial [uncultured Friedmanniella sp.]